MMKKLAFLTIFFLGFVALNGCATIYHTVSGFGEGVTKDAKSVWESMGKAEEWFQEHTW